MAGPSRRTLMCLSLAIAWVISCFETVETISLDHESWLI
jgi:hypothetical protein